MKGAPHAGSCGARKVYRRATRRTLPLTPVERAFGEFAIEQPVWIDRTREDEPARRHWEKPHFAVIGHVADEQDQPVPGRSRRVERFLHQLFADAPRAEGRIDGQRPQQQGRWSLRRKKWVSSGWRRPAKCRPGRRRTGCNPARLLPAGDRPNGRTARAESALVELLDRREIGGRLRAEV